MRPTIRSLTPLLLAAAALLAATSARAATPAACAGRFAIAGPPPDLGAGPIAVVTVSSTSVTLGNACAAIAVVRAPRTDVVALRARFGACGDLPRLRVRLLFDTDCGRVAGRVRSAGRTVAEFTAIASPATGVPDAPSAPPAVPVTDPTTDPAPPPSDTTPIGSSAKLTVVSPLGARVGDTITVFGTNLDHDRNGQPWSGPPPYVVQFRRDGGDGGAVRATFTVVSATTLRVVVPAHAASDTIALAERRADGTTGPVFARSFDRFLVVQPDTSTSPPPARTPPPATTNRGTLVVQASEQNALSPGTFALSGAANQVGAFLDGNRNGFIDLGAGRTDVPFPAFPQRTSSVDLTITPGRGYFAGANAILWVFFEGGDPSVLDNRDVFVAVHLAVDLAARTARPIALVAGVAGSPGIIVSTDEFTASSFAIDPPVVGGPGALRAHLSAVPSFLELVFLPSQPIAPGVPDLGPSFFERLWANGIVLDIDVPLFNDAA